MKYIIALFCLIFTTNLYSSNKLSDISIKSAVTFNTLCAKCHEGQCSGRLTFDTGSDAASNHIKRYSDDVNISNIEIKEYFTLLNYMKKECLLFMPNSKKWRVDKLLNFALPSRKTYFIPLGILKSGEYKLLIKTKKEIRYRVEVISNDFDTFLDTSVYSNTQEKLFNFRLDKSTNYFLRIGSKESVIITNLEIKIISPL